VITSAIRRIDSDEAGFGIVEVMVASVLLAVGILGTMLALDGATRGSFSAQRHEQAISLAQRELEKITAYPFARIELDGYPSAVVDPTPNNPSDPRQYVSGTNFQIKKNYNNSAAGKPADTGTTEPLVADPDGDPAADGYSIPTISQNVPIGPPSAGGVQQEATIWRFVTYRDENCAVLGLIDLCPAEQGSKRITVAVALEPSGNGSGPSKPTYLTSLVTDPDAAALDLPLDDLGL
jgi:Tfp pilus assembly protein PilV